VPSRWDVYRVNFGRRDGNEPAGTHRSVVVSYDDLNQHTPYVTVCPITGADRRLYPCEVRHPAGGPLDVDSIIQVQLIRTIGDYRLLGDPLGRVLDPEIQGRIEQALRTLLALSADR
jgi:mRNA-degrading endonuclease toxin of MazEF toxin-antitoxin module